MKSLPADTPHVTIALKGADVRASNGGNELLEQARDRGQAEAAAQGLELTGVYAVAGDLGRDVVLVHFETTAATIPAASAPDAAPAA